MNEFDDTIAALSSAFGKAGVAVIRISGKDAIEVASRVFFPFDKKAVCEHSPRFAIYGEIVCDGVRTDTGLCTYFKGPNSYTGEDTCEINVHGSSVGTSMILSALYQNGARPAQAGEFTKRAFINGKLSLSQAEAVGELIEAESFAAQVLSNARVKGALSKKIDGLCDSICEILSSIYAYIDYPDEDLADMSAKEIKDGVESILYQVNKLVSGYDVGKAISEGVNCAIVGSPNVGKSSFLNFLSGSDRAIVTNIAGTTRDVVTDLVNIANVRLKLSDTAGIREDTSDEVEKIGIKRSLEVMNEAEVIFAIFDVTQIPDKSDILVLEKLAEYDEEKNIVYILNKWDKEDKNEKALSLFENKKNVIRFSAKTGFGKAELEEVISNFYPAGNSELEEGLIVTNARQYASLKSAAASLEEVLKTLEGYTGDLAGFDLEKALEHLRQTNGRSVSEEIVNGIFSRFCVGK